MRRNSRHHWFVACAAVAICLALPGCGDSTTQGQGKALPSTEPVAPAAAAVPAPAPSTESASKGGGGAYGLVIADRFIVDAKSTSVDVNTLKAAVGSLDLGKLEAMKNEGVKK